ncbi:MAG: hypothetical protein IJ553_04590 [Alloprevotella sp.]|nr:hypothetical protein [Alloprevotella sp.]
MNKSVQQPSPQEALRQRRREIEAQLRQEEYLIRRQTNSLMRRHQHALRLGDLVGTAFTHVLSVSKVAVPLWRIAKRLKRRK